MSIEIAISQRCGGEYGQEVYFAADCTATFSLDGNADNACMMAASAVAGQIKAHNGDTLLIVIKVNGELRARWVGEASADAAGEFDGFLASGKMWDFAYVARRIAMHDIRAGRRLAPGKAIELDIDDATQFATVYLAGKPIATVQRRRVLDSANQYPWQAFALDGTRILAQTGSSVKSLRRRMQNFADGTGMFRDHPLSPANKEG